MIVRVIKNQLFKKKCAYRVSNITINHKDLNRDVARSYSCLVIGGEGEGVAEYATERHIFNFMENFLNPKFMF